jgi:hypothetical protein
MGWQVHATTPGLLVDRGLTEFLTGGQPQPIIHPDLSNDLLMAVPYMHKDFHGIHDYFAWSNIQEHVDKLCMSGFKHEMTLPWSQQGNAILSRNESKLKN